MTAASWIWYCAKRVATRRISCTDQRISGGLLFGRAGMLALMRMAASIAKASMTSETCRCQPCQERVSLWSWPSSFWPSRAVLDGPAPSFNADQHRNWVAGGAPGGEKGQGAVNGVAADQQASGPKTGQALVVFGPFHFSQFEIGPVEQPLAVGSGPGRQTTPGGGIKVVRNLGCGPGH